MEFILFCPERYLPKTCHISGFGSTIKGLKLFGKKVNEDFSVLSAGCTARLITLSGQDTPTKLPMTVVCSPRVIPDPCRLESDMQAHHVHFRRNRTASIQCNPGYIMHACSLTVIAPTMDWLKMELPDDTGQICKYI